MACGHSLEVGTLWKRARFGRMLVASVSVGSLISRSETRMQVKAVPWGDGGNTAWGMGKGDREG